MADEPAPAPAEEQAPAPAPQTPAPAQTPKDAPASAPPQGRDDDTERLTALIRNHYTNTALSRDQLAWDCFEAGLPSLVTAIQEA